jgi:thioredoxin 1
MMTPVIESIAQEMAGELKVAKLDIDSSQKTTSSFGVTSIPTLILFKDGKELTRIVGLKDKKSLQQLIQSANH